MNVGEKIEAYGHVQCKGNPVAEASVTISARYVGHPHGTQLGVVTTNTEGNFAAEIPAVNYNAEIIASYKNRYGHAMAVAVTPRLTFEGPAEKTQLLTGRANAVKFSGTVTPFDTGARVMLQREDAFTEGVWHTVQYARVKGDGSYSFTHTFWVPGSASLRVVVAPHHRYTVRGISETRVYEISQSQVAGLSIKTKQQPVLWGTPVTIEGESSAGEGKTVELWSRPTHFGHFAKVAETTTGPGGTYSFNRTPTESRMYYVVVGTTRSAILALGVHYGLKLTSSWPASLASGEKLIVEGETTGVPAGHRVLLQRENKFGHTFHNIGEAVVDAEGKFKLEDVLIGSGPTAVRVKVPGDLGHRAAWSNRAAIELTPAPPTLTLPTPTPVLPIS